MNQEQIMQEIQLELNKCSQKYKGEFDHMSEDERNKLTNIAVDMFMAGFNYGINTAKHLV